MSSQLNRRARTVAMPRCIVHECSAMLPKQLPGGVQAASFTNVIDKVKDGCGNFFRTLQRNPVTTFGDLKMTSMNAPLHPEFPFREFLRRSIRCRQNCYGDLR